MATAGKLHPTTALPGALQRYFEVALYLLVVTGFGTLASTGGLGIGAVAPGQRRAAVRGYLLFHGRTWLISERWTALLTLGYVAFYLADYFLISGGFLNATVHLVLFVMVVRLFSAQRDRDFYFLSVIAFLMVLASALLTVDSAFLLSFAIFMLMAVVCFILMEMRHISAKAGVQARAVGHETDVPEHGDLSGCGFACAGALHSAGCGRDFLPLASRLCRLPGRVRSGR